MILDELYGFNVEVQELKILDGQDIEDITAWTIKSENNIGQYEGWLDSLESTANEIIEHKHHREVAIEKRGRKDVSSECLKKKSALPR